MNAIQRMIAILTGNAPKAEIISLTCPECGHEFDVTTNKSDDGEGWRTDPETGISTGDNDPANEGADDESDTLNMTTPKQRAAKEADIAKSILLTAKQRDFVGAKPHEIGPQKSIEIVADKQAIENASPVDLLAAALNKTAREARR